ncbi:MAG: Zn-dependent alcohol dehydrogenase [Rhodoglobus sp.]|nr:Zn-dependent alcohol dehydrogenase [Rhodoglobus sp.]
MRAAVFREAGKRMVVEDVELNAPGAGEVLVRIEAAGVCHSDYHYMTGDISCPMPIVLGHEGSGIVEAVGADSSDRIRVGDRVALLWRPRCGNCLACVTGNPVLCQFGRVLATTGGLLDGTSRLHKGDERIHHFLGVSCFAERVVVSETSVVPVPDGVPPEVAAVAGCAVITGVGAVLNVVTGGSGQPLVVLGSGGVGLSSIMGARLIGANPIIAVDLDPAKLELARHFGATHSVDAREGDAVKRVLDIIPTGAPWVVDAIGAPTTLAEGLAVLAPGGTLIAVGLARGDATVPVPINDLVQKQKRIVGSLYGSSNPLVDLPRIFGLYLAGRLPLDDLIGEHFPLASVNEAYEQLMTGSVGRMILVP